MTTVICATAAVAQTPKTSIRVRIFLFSFIILQKFEVYDSHAAKLSFSFLLAGSEVITEILRSLKKLIAYIVHPPIPFTFAEKKRIWKKQIKTVWILTIITALLIIGGQAYWLYNQYGYSADEHMRNLHAEILKLENAEFEARYQAAYRQYSDDFELQHRNARLDQQ